MHAYIYAAPIKYNVVKHRHIFSRVMLKNKIEWRKIKVFIRPLGKTSKMLTFFWCMAHLRWHIDITEIGRSALQTSMWHQLDKHAGTTAWKISKMHHDPHQLVFVAMDQTFFLSFHLISNILIQYWFLWTNINNLSEKYHLK